MTTVSTPDPAPFEIRDPGPAPAGIEMSIELIGPEEASEFLLANPFNRKPRPSHIKKLVGAMARGEFSFNGDPIRVSQHGDLLDGQHRCEAIVESGQSVWAVVIRGLPDQVIHTIDTDMAPRNLRDVLKIGGEVHYETLATAITWKWRKETAVLQTKDSPTPAQALAILDKHPALRETATACSGVRALRALKVNRGLVAALLYEFRSIDDEDATNFFEKFTLGAGLEEGDPILVLRAWVQRMAAAEAKKKATAVEVYMTFVKAWNLWRGGQKTKTVAWVATKHVPQDPR